MGEVLSQSEIDSLLQALSTGELDADEIKDDGDKAIKEYDFKRPAKFSKEHLRTLEIIYEHYSRLLSTNLPVYLRKNIQVNVINSETVTFSEFTNSLLNPVLLGIIDFAPLDGRIIVDLSPKLAFAMIDMMLGGMGVPLEKEREFSEIELSIIGKIIVICIQLLREPWKNVVEIQPVLERLEMNSQFAQIIAPTEMIAMVTLSIKVGDVEGLMNFFLPYLTMESIMYKLNTKYWFSTMRDRSDDDYEMYIESMIRKVEMPVKAVLGKSILSVNDFINLQIGDIIRLDSKVEEELDIYVGNLRKFTALPGASQDAYAVRVTSVYREGE